MPGYLLQDVANEALDAIAWPEVLGDLENGNREAQVILRAYWRCLEQLLRAAHWSFARKQAPLVLLADASGNTANVGTVVPFNWLYEYQYPNDCMKMRFVPMNLQNQASIIPANNIQTPQTPLVGGIGQNLLPGARVIPALFQIGFDYNYPPPPGPANYDTPGVSPAGRTVILTNVRLASAVYTALVEYPSVWDSLFRSAMTAYLASEIAMPIWAKRDPKFGMQIRDDQINILKSKVAEARAVDGNETPQSSDIRVDWMDARRVGWGTWPGAWGGAGGAAWGQQGVYGYGWDSLSVSGGANF